MARKFPGRQEAFFFRRDAQSYLERRLRLPGLTVVRGRTRAGKSWLIGQVLRQISESSPDTLIGFARCSAQDGDNLLRVIDDLYLRWREHADLLDQAKELFRLNKCHWLPLVAKAIGVALNAAQPLGPASGVASAGLRKLASMGLGPSFQVPRLKYDEAQQLVSALATISSADRAILVLDAWEHSGDISYEAEHLRELVHDPEGWGNTHVIVGVEAGSEESALLEKICDGFRPWTDIYDVLPLDTSSEPREKERLTAFLRDIVPACKAIERADDYLCLIDGYAGVLDNWTRAQVCEQLKTLDDLRRAAQEAKRGQYPEFDNKLPRLDDATRKLCMRFALLPGSDESGWPALRATLMDGIPESSLDRLSAEGLLESFEPPSFGHGSRHVYFCRWLVINCKNELREQCAWLTLTLARMVQTITPDSAQCILALAALYSPAKLLQVDDLTLGLCEVAIGLTGGTIHSNLLLQTSKHLRNQMDAGLAVITAMGLFNALESANIRNDLSARDVFLEELRQFQRCYEGSSRVLESLSRALFNGLKYAQRAENFGLRNQLLDELQDLQRRYAHDDEVRRFLAHALFDTLDKASVPANFNRQAANLNQLRSLVCEFPDDSELYHNLASALANSLLLTSWTNHGGARNNELLAELRALRKRYSKDEAVGERLAAALFGALYRSLFRPEVDSYKQEELLDELRTLLQDFPGDAKIRGHLANALLYSVISAHRSYAMDRSDSLRSELDILHQAYPDDDVVSERLAQSYPPTDW